MKMNSKRALSALALAASAALVLSSCSGGGSDAPAEEDNAGADVQRSTDALHIATLLPQTGGLNFMMPAVQAGIATALKDINDAGGVLGSPVEVVAEGNEGEATDLSVVEGGAAKVIASDATFVLGAMGSGRTQHVVDRIAEAGMLMGSPSNTAASLNGISPNYFRTAPPDTVQGSALAQQIIADGKASAAFLTFNDPYGLGLRDVIQETLEAAGVETVYGGKGDGHEFPDNESAFSSQVAAVKDSGAEAIVVVTYNQIVPIVKEAVNQGVPVSNFYLVDGNTNAFNPDHEDEASRLPAGTMEGAQGSIPGAYADEAFRDQLKAVYNEEFGSTLESFIYSPESFDLVTIVALAAEKAGSADASAMQAVLHQVTGANADGTPNSGATECTTFVECRDLIADGEEIRYFGKSGTGPLDSDNNPSSAFIGIYKYDANNVPQFQRAVEGTTK